MTDDTEDHTIRLIEQIQAEMNKRFDNLDVLIDRMIHNLEETARTSAGEENDVRERDERDAV